MHIHINKYTYTYTYICIYIYTYIQTYMYIIYILYEQVTLLERECVQLDTCALHANTYLKHIHTYIHTCVYIYMYIYMYIFIHTCKQICTSYTCYMNKSRTWSGNAGGSIHELCVHINKYTYTYTYIYTHQYIYIYIHTHKNICRSYTYYMNKSRTWSGSACGLVHAFRWNLTHCRHHIESVI